MLVLERKRGEKIVVDLRIAGLGLLEIYVTEICSRNRAKIGIVCDRCIPVYREEVLRAREREQEQRQPPAVAATPKKSGASIKKEVMK